MRSQLRLSEAPALHWTASSQLTIDNIDAKKPMFLIHGSQEKGRQDRSLPAAPDFCRWLRSLDGPRRGLILAPVSSRGGRIVWMQHASKKVSEIGKRANVIVRAKPVKYASAHDLRRAFGARWAVLVMPNTLQAMMRHESIETTTKYYVGQDAERIADAMYSAEAKGGASILDGLDEEALNLVVKELYSKLAPKDLNLD